ncbi:hypothetical protein ACFV2Z_27770 [Streptomyces sp. NPDC059688]|uniref:hypothetical protein n=1 Tax=unclassified Streptomyces TaxID=2593676 RepID=UPI002FDB9823
MTVGGWCRTLRAGVFAAACVLLAALGHVLMSGVPVPWWAMAAGAAGTGAAGWCLAGRERGQALIVTVVVGAQAVLHEGFSLAQTFVSGRSEGPPAVARGVDTMGMGAGPAGSGHMDAMDMGATHVGSLHMGPMHMGSLHMDAMHMPGLGDTGPGSVTPMGPSMHMAHSMGGDGTFGMFAAHLLAAILCGLWLAHGERAVFRLLRTAATRLVAPLRMLLALPVPPSRPPVRRRRAPGHRRLARLLLCHAIISRGPPVGLAVA